MINDNEKRINANRLAWAIYRHADEITIKRLAALLNYEVAQLKQDIHDLPSYISELEAGVSDESDDFDEF